MYRFFVLVTIGITIVLCSGWELNRPTGALYANYINQYKDLAVREMVHSRIPASIILAQAVVESNAGKSKLALYANNHFGIKCKEAWEGERYYFFDDDYDKNGRLIKSCFRSYEKVNDSYRDHTAFLKDAVHYRMLFSFEITDYKNWARGLHLLGYASDPEYAEKLVKIIENNKLYLLDNKQDFPVQAIEKDIKELFADPEKSGSILIPTGYQRRR